MVPLAVEEPDLGLPPLEASQVAWGAGVALGVLLLARVVRLVLRRVWGRRHSASYARVFSRLVSWLVGALGVGVGLTVAFPSVQPVDLLGGVGIVSVAVGIAFQSVLSNLFAGVLLLVREPFRAGDQIAVGDVAGTVEDVNLRETVLRTFDGRRVLVPNSTVHGEIVTVQTGYEDIRTCVAVGVSYGADLAAARRLAAEAASATEGVADEPAPQCLLVGFGASTMDLELRYWAGSRQLETVETRDRVVAAVHAALTAAGIEMPADIRVLEAAPSLAAALAGSRRHPAAG